MIFEAYESIDIPEESDNRIIANISGHYNVRELSKKNNVKPFRIRRLVATIMIVILGVGGIKVAAEEPLDNVFHRFITFDENLEQKYSDIIQPIEISKTCGNITVTAKSVIGNNRDFIVEFLVTNNDGIFNVPQNDDESVPAGFNRVYSEISYPGIIVGGQSYAFYDNVPGDNEITFYLDVNTTTSIIMPIVRGKTVNIELTDILIKENGIDNPATVLSGEWSFSFPLSYENYTRYFSVDSEMESIIGVTQKITEFSVSPIGFHISFIGTGIYDKEIYTKFFNKVMRSANDPADTIAFVFNDGTMLEMDLIFTSGALSEDKGASHQESDMSFDKAINPYEIKTILINGKEVVGE